MNRNEKIQKAKERIKELKTLIKHWEQLKNESK